MFTIGIFIAIVIAKIDDVPRYSFSTWTKNINGEKVEIKGTLYQIE